MSDAAREIARIIVEDIDDDIDHERGIVDGDDGARITSVAMYGMASVQVVLSDGRTFLVDVNEGPLATPNQRTT